MTDGGPSSMRRAEEIFHAVVDLPPAEQGPALERLCAGDNALADTVRRLLASETGATHWLDAPAIALDQHPGGADAGHEPIPDQLGSYRILRVIGEGGMGRVYEAEQSSPKRTVALKVIRPGLLHRGVLRRFEHEAAILGQLHHPGIAQVYEAGTVQTPAGKQPFIAMELVRGEPLDAFCRRLNLPPRERLALIAAVCDAVQHAHQMGVIHRDLKPGNILVEPAGDTTTASASRTGTAWAGAAAGRPRIVDFGIARATGVDDASTITMNTEPGALIGTLGYMSPEQALGGAPVDTRSDVYALGAILYELLADRPAIDVRGIPIAEAARRVREQEPDDLGRIAPVLRGDVATIVSKSLSKEPGRRYASAGELGADIRRHLADEPILARRASRTYLLGKFARRNKSLVAAVVVVALTLVAATVISTGLYIQTHAARIAEAGQRRVAERAAADTEAINDFLLTDLLRAATPERDGQNTSVVQVFRRARDAVSERFADRPTLEVQVRARIADVLEAIGEPRAAIEQAAVVLQACDRLEPTVDPQDDDLRERIEYARIQALRSSSASHATLREFDEAESAVRRAIELAEHCTRSGRADRAQLLTLLGDIHQVTGRHDEAERELLTALSQLDRTKMPELRAAVSAMSSLAGLYLAEHEQAKAEDMLRQILAESGRPGAEISTATIAAMSNLSVIYQNENKYDQALPYAEAAWVGMKRVFPETHPTRFYTEFGYGSCLYSLARYDDAEPRLLGALSNCEKHFGAGRFETERATIALRDLYIKWNKYDKALQFIRRALVARFLQSSTGELDTLGRTVDTFNAKMKLAAADESAGNWPAWFFECGEKEVPPNHPRRSRYFANLGYALMGSGREDDALRSLELAWTARESTDTPEFTPFTAKLLGAIHQARGNTAEADKWKALAGQPPKK